MRNAELPSPQWIDNEIATALYRAAEGQDDTKQLLKETKKAIKRQRGDLERALARLQQKRDYDGRLREAHNRRYRRVQAELDAIASALRAVITDDPHRDKLVDRLTALIASLHQPLDAEMHQPEPPISAPARPVSEDRSIPISTAARDWKLPLKNT